MSKSRPTPYDCLDKEQIAPTLHELRLPGMLNSYLTQKKILGISEYSFEDRLGMMLYEEVTGRNYRRQARLFQASGLRNTGASAGTILYDKERNLDKGLVTELMSCRWIQSDCPPNLIVTGAAGTGKNLPRRSNRSQCDTGRYLCSLLALPSTLRKNDRSVQPQRIQCSASQN